jgi:hypothetical protein
MPTVALLGQGVLLQAAPRGDTSPFAWTTFADVLSMRGPTSRSDKIDVTSHSSPAGTREKIAGLRDYGELSFAVNLNPGEDTHRDLDGLAVTATKIDGLAYMFRTGTAYDFRLRFPQVSPVRNKLFRGQVVGFEHDLPVDSQMRADITIELSGLITEKSG